MLAKILKVAEVILLLVAIAGAALKALNQPGAAMLLLFGLGPLAIVYFARAFQPVEIRAQKDDTPRDFTDLLLLVIIPKFMWIGSSVGIYGILCGLLNLKGARQMVTISSSTLGIASLVVLYGVLTSKDVSNATSPLYRAIPVFLIGVYLFMNLPG